jgi:Domain of unknown function (DUF4411)
LSHVKHVYLFDSDVLIGAHRTQYNNLFCEAFWVWLIDGINQNIFRTAMNVKDELSKGNDGDFLKETTKLEQYANFWKSTNIPSVISIYADVQNWASTEWRKGKSGKNNKNEAQLQNALTIFAGNIADPWLVALAVHTQNQEGVLVTIVTHEKSNPSSVSRVMLPDAAKAKGISTITLFDLLKLHSSQNFVFKL